MAEPIRIVDGLGKSRFIGMLYNDTLHMDREKSKHFFRKLKAWAIDLETLHQRPDIQNFILTDKENGTRYIAVRRDFDSYGQIISYQEHLKQVALPVQYWTRFKVS